MKLGITLPGGEMLEAGQRAREAEDLEAAGVHMAAAGWERHRRLRCLPGPRHALPGLVTVFARRRAGVAAPGPGGDGEPATDAMSRRSPTSAARCGAPPVTP